MDSPSLPALLTGVSAFILYTASTLSLRRGGQLHAYHVAAFCLAFALILASTMLGPLAAGTFDTPLRIFIAVSMLSLPAIHAIWALAAWSRHSERLVEGLRSVGTLLWALWLIPYFAALFFLFAGRIGDIPLFALSTMTVLALLLCLRGSETGQHI